MSSPGVRSCARAPVRVDPAGGGTDAPPFCIDHGGMVVNFGVNLHAYASVDRLARGEGVVIYSSDLDTGVEATSIAALPEQGRLEFLAGFVRRLVPEEDSILLVTDSDVPAGGGLGGSGAIGVAVVAAIDRAYGNTRSRAEIAALANEIERVDLGYPGGSQDSYGAALGGMNRLEYHEGGGMSPHGIAVGVDTRRALERASVLVYTAAAHVSGSIHEDIRRSYADDGSPTVRAMLSLREQASKMCVALEAGNIGGYIDALNESCRSLYALHPSCDSEDHQRLFRELDSLILGGKTCGAGGGGFALLHTRPGRRGECIRRAREIGARVWPLTIDLEGVVSWTEDAASEEEIRRYRERTAV